MKRRAFIKSSLAAMSLLANPLLNVSFGAGLSSPKYLVLLELHGGNDGLNTFVPLDDPAYIESRATLALTPNQMIKINAKLAFNNQLEKIMPLFESNEMAIIHGLGYENPNRSHFRSIDIWDTASKTNEYLKQGWINAYKPNSLHENIADAVVIGRNTGPVKGSRHNAIKIKSVEKFNKQAARIKSNGMNPKESALKYLLNVQTLTKKAGSKLQQMVAGSRVKLPDFPDTQIGQDFKEAAHLILLGKVAPVFKVGLSGFDTHQEQSATHNQLLSEMAEAIATFTSVIKRAGLWDQVAIMSYSEFGRRVAVNGSGGTDHGTAAPHFVLGGTVKGAVIGQQPNVSDLVNGDLKYTTHFKSYYNSIITQWWQADSVFIDYPALDIFKEG